MNRMRSEKKVATLSIVLSMTRSCRLRAGINRTNFKIRNKRNVRNTETPLGPVDTDPPLKRRLMNCLNTSYTLWPRIRCKYEYTNKYANKYTNKYTSKYKYKYKWFIIVHSIHML